MAVKFYALGFSPSFEHNKTVDVKLTEHDDVKRLLAEKIWDPDENTQTDILMWHNKDALIIKDPWWDVRRYYFRILRN